MLGVRNNHCFSPRPPSWHPQRNRGRVSVPCVLSLGSYLLFRSVRVFSWGGPGRRAKRSLQRAAFAWTDCGQRLQSSGVAVWSKVASKWENDFLFATTKHRPWK